MKFPRLLEGDRKRLMVRLVANGIAQGIAAIVGARFVHYTFDHSIRSQAPFTAGTFAALAAGIAGTTFSLAWLRTAERTDAERLSQGFVKQLRVVLFEHMSGAPARILQRKSRGAMMLRFIGDVKALRQWVSVGLSRLIVACVSVSASLAGLAWLNVPMAVAALLVIATGVASGFAWGRRMENALREARRRQSELAANVDDKLASMSVVQAFGQSDRERQRMEKQSNRLMNAMIARARVAAQLKALSDITSALASGAVMLVGSYEVKAGATTPGTVAAAMAIIGLAVPVLRELGNAFIYWQGARLSGSKIREFLETPGIANIAPGVPDLAPGPGRLVFEDVHYAGALRGVSATVEPGTRVAIVGPNGAGKSTLLAIAARLMDPERGRVLIDGQDVSQVSLASIRRRLGMVSPDLPLLRGSLENNLRYRWWEAPEEELAKIVELCGIDEILGELPEGLQTRVTEGGRNLSPGQRQRVALGRALLAKPEILLLDEADANLDPRSRPIVERILDRFNGTVLIVTHQREWLEKAHVLWHLENGTLTEKGIPEEVLAGDGPTARLFGLRARKDQTQNAEG